MTIEGANDPPVATDDAYQTDEDTTLTVGVPKRGLLDPAAANHVGRIELIPLAELPPPDCGELRLITPHTLDLRTPSGLKKPRTR